MDHGILLVKPDFAEKMSSRLLCKCIQWLIFRFARTGFFTVKMTVKSVEKLKISQYIKDMADRKSFSVFEYLDYRALLKDYCAWRKSRFPSFSYAGFFKKGGLPLNNTTLLSRVISGKRNLSQSLRYRFARAMELEGDEQNYFELLVQFNQAKDLEQKNFFFTELSRYRSSLANAMNEQQQHVHGKWHYHVVLTYLGMRKRITSARAIAAEIYPPISPDDVEEAIQTLLDLKLIKKVANGYDINYKHLASGPGIRNMQGKKAVKDLTRLSMEVYDSLPSKSRDYSFMTMSLSERGFRALKERMKSFREEIRVLLEKDSNEDRIYTFTMQFFPNTKVF
jgi:uncharacterized protein (TIGR02147 family)